MESLLLIKPEGMLEEENIGGDLSEDVKGMWKKSFSGTDAFVPRESLHLTYRIHSATDNLSKEIAATENPLKLREFSPPEPITSRGITFNEIRYGGHVFKLMVPIKVEPEPSTEGWILYHEELSILAAAPTIEECIDEFKDYFYVLWEEYAYKKDDELTDSGQALKHKLLDVVE